MAKVIAVLLQSRRFFFEALQKILIYFFMISGFVAIAIAFISFQTSIYGLVCFAVGLLSMLAADYVSRIE